MAAAQRTIAVITGTRAEFGLLLPVMRAIDAHRRLALRTVVCGTHLTTGTWRDVRAAGFVIHAKVRMQQRGASGRAADVRALGRGIRETGEALARLSPDVVLVLGDRIEALAGATAASVGGFHLAHIHGGDRAEGVADEAMRHAISKLAHLHFAATAQSRRRLVRMGEDPTYVFNVGSPAADGLRHAAAAPDAPEIIVMQHPIGEPDERERRWMQGTLQATRGRPRMVMMPNRDPGREGIMAALKQANVAAVAHVPRDRFVSLLKGAKAIVGNSSAGLIEAAVLGTACVNVGSRQGGREKPANVIDCDYGQRNVSRALRQALNTNLSRLRHPYGNGHSGERIAAHLATIDPAHMPLHKRNTY